MAIMSWTYSTLTSAVQQWTEDDSTEFVAAIPDIIGLAEMRIYREVDLDAFRKSATSALTVGDRYLSKPTDFVLDRFMFVTISNERVYLDRKDMSFINDFWPSTLTSGVGISQPRYYSEWDDDTFVIAPTPDTAHTVTIGYIGRPARLSSSTTTTWLSINAPDVLLYACLCESAAFLQDLPRGQEPGMLDVWEAKYKENLLRLRDEEMRRQRRTEFRHGESRGEI